MFLRFFYIFFKNKSVGKRKRPLTGADKAKPERKGRTRERLKHVLNMSHGESGHEKLLSYEVVVYYIGASSHRSI